MTAKTITPFRPMSGARALLDLIYAGKHSRNVPLVVVLLSAVYAVFRSYHYLTIEFRLPPIVAVPTAVFIEALVLGAAALVFIAFRERFIARLKAEDEEIAQAGVYLSLTFLCVAYVTLLFIAGADAWLVTQAVLPSAIMALAQASQAGFIAAFLISALLEEYGKLRTEYAEYERRTCQYCRMPQLPQNKARHEATCGKNPKRAGD